MAYIGKSPSVGGYNMLDNLTASATASYSLTLDSTAFVPESSNHLIVSLNGVIQKAGSSFTVSGSTLTFSSALTSSDSIDFVLALGNVLDIGTPSDATVTNAKTNFVSTSSAAGLQIKGDGTTDGTLQLNCSQNSHGIKLKSPAHSASQSYTLTFPTTSPSADKFLQTDGSGNLSFADAGTNTPNFNVYLGSNVGIAHATTTVLVFDSEDFDTASAYNTSNGRFTVPSGQGGKYMFGAHARTNSSNTMTRFVIQLRVNGTVFIESNMNNSDEDTTTTHGIVNIAAGDYVDVTIYQNAGATKTIFGNSFRTRFYGYKLAT